MRNDHIKSKNRICATILRFLILKIGTTTTANLNEKKNVFLHVQQNRFN